MCNAQKTCTLRDCGKNETEYRERPGSALPVVQSSFLRWKMWGLFRKLRGSAIVEVSEAVARGFRWARGGDGCGDGSFGEDCRFLWVNETGLIISLRKFPAGERPELNRRL